MKDIVAIMVLVTTPFVLALGIMAVNGWMLLWDRVLDWSGAR